MNRIIVGGIAAAALAGSALALAGTAQADTTCTREIGTGTVSVNCTTDGWNTGSFSAQYAPATGLSVHKDINGSEWNIVANESERSYTGNIAGWHMDWSFVNDREAKTFVGELNVYNNSVKVTDTLGDRQLPKVTAKFNGGTAD